MSNFTVTKATSETVSATNTVSCNSNDLQDGSYIKVTTDYNPSAQYAFRVR